MSSMMRCGATGEAGRNRGWAKWGARWGARCVAGVLAIVALAGCETVGGVVKDVKKLAQSPATGEPYRTYTNEPEVRIRVSRDATTTELSGPSQLVARPALVTGGATAVMTTPITVSSSSTGIETTDGLGRKRTWGSGVDVEFLTSQSPTFAAESIKVGKSMYPGFVAIKPRWNDAPARFDVIVTMPIETYLPGVLTHELYKDWPRQAYEAQSVASRTYALHERSRARREGRNWDVEDTTDDQVYGGSTPSIVASEAARATRGRVLTFDGFLLRAYFSSCCGGRPASGEEVWAGTDKNSFNRLEPLQGKTRPFFCQAAPMYRWQVTRSVDDVSRRLRAWGRGANHDVQKIGRVRGIAVKDRNDAGRPNSFKVTDSSGEEFTLEAESIRQALNTPTGDLPGITKENRVSSGDFEAEFFADSVRFIGRGWGHGVGMCQWCAAGMAKSGWDWNTMIKTFYPNVQVQKAY